MSEKKTKQKGPTIREKSTYITELIEKQNGLKKENVKAYQYIYDITKFLVYKKINTRNLTSEIPEDIIQNIVIQVFKRFNYDFLKDKNKDANLMSIFPYLSKCVHAEASRLKTSAYGGNLPRIDENLKETLFFKEDIVYHPTFETEVVIKIEKKIKNIIFEVKSLLDENIISVKNKNFILFPLLISISRRNLTLFNNYPDGVKSLLRQIYNNTKDPLDRIKV